MKALVVGLCCVNFINLIGVVADVRRQRLVLRDIRCLMSRIVILTLIYNPIDLNFFVLAKDKFHGNFYKITINVEL
jgi:hypothetical protein